MVLLSVGVLLFALVHFIPSLMPELKNSGMQKLGEGGYKGLFSLLLMASFGLMIYGWRTAEFSYLYNAPVSLKSTALAIMALAFLLFAASSLKTRLKRYIRHPQLTGVALWAVAHLLMNGDSRSVVLFTGLGLWAILSMVFINRREGSWNKEDIPALSAEFILITVAAATIAVTVAVHPWISGVSVF